MGDGLQVVCKVVERITKRMRYTTLIDISEIPIIYRNQNTRLLYLHLALKAGYHDNDRDLCDVSIRRLAVEVGLSISATRHALAILQKFQLIEKSGTLWKVKKFVLEQPITTRPKSEKKRKEQEAEQQRKAAEIEQKQREDEEKRKERELRKSGKTSFMLYFEEMQAKAAQGDPDALDIVRKNQKFYDMQANKMKNQASK